MSHPGHLSPSPTATVIHTGRQAARRVLPRGIVLTALGALTLSGGTVALAGLGGKAPNPAGLGGILIGLLMGFVGVSSIVAAWAARRSTLAVDESGLWVNNGTAESVIPWKDLAGVGLHWSRTGRGSGQVCSLELYPNSPIPHGGSVLGSLVRDEEPLRPGLPRLRYRLTLPASSRDSVVAAVQRQVPHLWCTAPSGASR
ncbi:hypothetical protein ACFV29_20700 [Streptomyces sp. NPDC059690]|uniref:hypothetical protein n=1 Tax=Streptomyces sp. NPDC059690 TaxID=3346907 RepID=UPI00368CC354